MEEEAGVAEDTPEGTLSEPSAGEMAAAGEAPDEQGDGDRPGEQSDGNRLGDQG